MELEYDQNYTYTFHSPGLEPWIMGFIKKNTWANALDLGCGMGFNAFTLKLYLKNIDYLVGLDISVEKLHKAKKLGLYGDVIVADARNPPFRVNTFDLLLSMDVIHIFSADIFDAIESVSKKGHTIALSMPYLPEGVSIKYLASRGYSSYRYLLRGFVLIDLEKYNVILAVNSRFFRRLKTLLTILMPFLRISSTLKKGYTLAFK
jgi:SAM-dependent methyltransferase